MELVGKRVEISFIQNCSGEKSTGILGFTEEFSEKHDYRKPNYFTINNIDFKVSHVRKVVVSDGSN